MEVRRCRQTLAMVSLEADVGETAVSPLLLNTHLEASSLQPTHVL